MEFEEWLKEAVKVEALRAFVDDAPDQCKRARLEELLHAQPEALARARTSYDIERAALSA
jgi:hypothetical protein